MALQFRCPLCNQSVSTKLYQKITGIWLERKKQLARIKEDRANLRNEIRQERARLREERSEFRRDRGQIIQNAVLKKTLTLETRLKTLKQKERKIKESYDLRLHRAIESEHRKVDATAKKMARTEISQMRRENRVFLKNEAKKAREIAREHEKARYDDARYKLNMTLQQMKTQGTKLRLSQERIKELERQLRKHTTPQKEGLLYETVLIQELKKNFRDDKFVHEGKRGDVLHYVMNNGWKVGLIVYECKRVQHFEPKFVSQTLAAKLSRGADFGILVTNAMKTGRHGFWIEKEVLIVHATGVMSLATVLRAQIVQIAEMKLGQEQKDKAIKLTIEYLQGPEFSNSMSSIIGETISLYDTLTDEMKKHLYAWRKRYASYSKIHQEALTVKKVSKEVLSGNEQYKDSVPESDYPALIELAALEQS